MNKKVLVIGSLNMDFSISVDKLPVCGETVLAKDMNLIPGGKGANQAYAMGKLGVDVSMIGAVGNDDYGIKLIENLKSVNVNIDGIKIIDGVQTGSAFVNVDNNGDNNIIVVGGANLEVTKDLIDENIDKFKESDFIVVQLEIPIETIKYIFDIAKKINKTIILDPAPAIKNIDASLLDGIDVIKPNKTELEVLTGNKILNNKDIIDSANKLLELGVKNVIVTLGEDGSILVNKDKNKHFQTFEVDVVDTTAAGDSFIAALVKSLAEGKPLEKSIKYAHIVSSYTVTKKGAQTSIPSVNELSNYISKVKNIIKERIIIDADPGTDDAFAISIAALSDELCIEGITTVAGNCSLENATNNTFKILDLCKRNDILVYKGMDKSMSKDVADASYVHGNNGLGGVQYKKIDRQPENIHAVDYLIEKVNKNPNEITVVALGPLTNIACAIEKNKDFSKNIKKLIIMGGAEDMGNVTPFAEFNFYKDPKAAKIVFENIKCDIFVVPLNVTHQFPLTKICEDRLQYLNYHLVNTNHEISDFLYKITRTGAKFDREHLNSNGIFMNDPVTILYLLDNTTLKFKAVDIDMIIDGEQEGMSVIKENNNSNIRIAYELVSDKCYNILFKKLFNIDL